MALNTDTSVVDYLKSIGQSSDIGSRSKIYASSGLNLGSYSGSADQNNALLSFLKGGSSSPAPGATASTTPTVAAPTPAPSTATAGGSRTDFTNNALTALLTADSGKAAAQTKAQQDLIAYYQNLPSVTDRYTKISQENGLGEQQKLVDALTKNVMQTEDSVDAVEPSVNGRTGDFLVTDRDRSALVAREKQPILDSLNKLLRNKQYEEIGLQGKQALVSNLLNLSLQDDQLRAKPLELGVDYTTEDRNTALGLWKEITGQQISAFNADTSAKESAAQNERDFQNSVALKKLEVSNSDGKTATKEAKDKQEAATQGAFDSFVGGPKTEYDVWKAINDNQDNLKKEGIDVDKLWQLHAALAAQVGQGGDVRKSADKTYTINGKTITIPG